MCTLEYRGSSSCGQIATLTKCSAIAFDKELGATRGIDAALQTFGVDALLMPTNVASGPAVIAGYPIVSGKSDAAPICTTSAVLNPAVTVPCGFLPATTPLGVARPVCESN